MIISVHFYFPFFLQYYFTIYNDTIRKNRAEQIADIIKEQELIKKFDEELFREVIERVTVLSIVEVEFQFKSGLKVKEIL